MALSRRRLLLVGGGVAWAHAIGCGGQAPIVLAKEIPAGNASALQVNSLHAVSGHAVAIGRDADGIYAISLVCTHESCDIAGSGGSVSFTLIRCGCHGSQFNGQGQVQLGPASRPLPHLDVTADAGGALTVHGDREVPAATRLET
jgi:cytochrome b6-f complex iron-sulfur subunit